MVMVVLVALTEAAESAFAIKNIYQSISLIFHLAGLRLTTNCKFDLSGDGTISIEEHKIRSIE